LKLRFYCLLLATAGTFVSVACTNPTTTTSSGDAGAAATSGPPIAADQVGASCSGVGTSPGDVAAFDKESCAAGICVADARSGFATYCTAECSANACPEGYACEPVTLGAERRVCLKDGTATPKPDAGGDATTKTGPIGKKTESPEKELDVGSVINGFTCDGVCAARGLECASTPAGFENRQKTNGNTNGGQIYTCGQDVPYSNNNGTLTSATCRCGQLPIVTVKASEGSYTCNEVCASWSLTCSPQRPSVTYPTAGTSGAVPLGCTTLAAATVNRTVCACDK